MAGWRKGYLYQWTGNGWIELDPREHGDKYMTALVDLLEHAPDGAFNNLFCMNLIAQEAFVRYLQALEITLSELTENGKTKRGSIKSQNFRAGLSGFKIDFDGNVEFNNGKFRGRIEAGEIQANYIKATGIVSSGTQYILRSNNTLSIIDSVNGGWIASTFDAVAKEIRTLARGSCTIRLRFPLVGSASSSNRNIGSYKIVVNDTTVRDWTSYSTNTDIDIPDVPLPNEVNLIKLYDAPSTAGNITSFGFYNSIFELRCSQDPAFWQCWVSYFLV